LNSFRVFSVFRGFLPLNGSSDGFRWGRFKTGAKISSAPTGRRKKLIFGGGAKPHRQKSIKERHLHDGRPAFSPKLKRPL
jgi:hypothetical protein